jgi:hypothetical protein
MSDLPDFAQYCEPACIKLWGEPDKRTKKELRWNGGDAYGARTYNVSKRTWYDHNAERGGSTLELIAYSKDLPDEKLRGRAFIDMWKALVDLGVGAPAPKSKSKSNGPPILAAYPYHDEQGVLLFEVVRFDTTDPDARFRQRRPDGKDGWVWDTKGVRKVLFRLPELIAAVKAGQRVFVTEGEKDANTAVKLGYAATTMPGGVGKWLKQYDPFFAGADVVVVSDNDAHGKGQAHAAKIAKRLSKVAAHVRTIIFPQKDLSAWVEAGGTREQMDALIEHAPEQAKQPPPKEEEDELDVEQEIERLARLSAVDYEQQRKGAAEKLGMRASILDKLVQAERVRLGLDGGDDGKQGHAVSFPEPEPWGEKVDGAALLNGIAAAIRRHVVMSKSASHICALWIVHTYLIDRFLVSPRLGICSPTKRCGKTLLLDVLNRLVARPLSTSNVTPAAIFRVVEAHRPTLLIDEADTFLYDNDELRGVLNGNRKGSTVLRTVGDDHEPRAFSVYSACAIALIGALPDTLHDRSATIDLQRRRARDRIRPFRPDRADYLDVLARKAARWTQDHATAIGDADPAMPSGIINRAADNWRSLLAIADAAKGKWPQRGRKAATVSHDAEGDDTSRLELLLGDIRDTFAAKGTKMQDLFGVEQVIMSSAKLVKTLNALEGRPWAEMGKSRKPLTPNGLARMLNRPGLKIAPKQVGPEKARVRGYILADFKNAFDRYLAPEGASQPSIRPACDEMGTSDISEVSSLKTGWTVAKCEKPNNDGPLDGWTVVKGGTGEKTPVVEPITAGEMDELRRRGFSPDELFDLSPTRARKIIADPGRNHLTERYGKGSAAPPETICRVCKKPGAKFFSEPLGPGERPDRFPLATPLHLECAPKFFEGGDLSSLGPDPLDDHGAPVSETVASVPPKL